MRDYRLPAFQYAQRCRMRENGTAVNFGETGRISRVVDMRVGQQNRGQTLRNQFQKLPAENTGCPVSARIRWSPAITR